MFYGAARSSPTCCCTVESGAIRADQEQDRAEVHGRAEVEQYRAEVHGQAEQDQVEVQERVERDQVEQDQAEVQERPERDQLRSWKKNNHRRKKNNYKLQCLSQK